MSPIPYTLFTTASFARNSRRTTRTHRRFVLLAAILFLAIRAGGAQSRFGIAYYDADRLYDTLPALFYDDSDHTPEGRLRWTGQRYRLKILRTAALLDSLAMNLVAISGVETEAVVRDLVTACDEDYCYIHRTFNTFDGLDIALLYHGDLFFPEQVEQGRGWLYAEGMLRTAGRRIGILTCNNARYATEALADCRERHPHTPLVVVGRFAPAHAARYGLRDLMTRAERSGQGNTRSHDGWRMRDRLLADTVLRPTEGRVYLRRFLFDPRDGGPLPTYRRSTYLGGCGSFLPVYSYLTRNYLEN